MSLLFNLISILIAFVAIAITVYKRTLNYWSRINVPQLDSKIPWGHISSLIKKDRQPIALDVKEYYDIMKGRGYKFAGFNILIDNNLLIIDPELIKDVWTRNFDYFTDRTQYANEKDPLSIHLLTLRGDKWRKTRAQLTPTFTSGKLKLMVDAVVDCGKPLVSKIYEMHEDKEPLDIRELSSRFTTDVIGRCAFGIECNSIINPDAEFRKYGKKAIQPDFITRIKIMFSRIFPTFAKIIGITTSPKDLTEFFIGVVKTNVEYRKKNNIKRNDFLQLLMDMMEDSKNEEVKFSIEQVAAHSFIFFLAGFETSSTTLTYCFYELAQNQRIQNKLREEINQVINNNKGQITYESLKEMKYLQQVIDETLRKYPPVPIVARTCTKDYIIPDTEIIVKKDKKIMVPIYALHHDPEYFPDPEMFDPDRFSEENKSSIKPFTFLPFGEGPRICIGSRFSYLETKIGIVTILRKFRVRLSEKSPAKLTMLPNALLLVNRETIYLNTETLI